LVLLPLYARYLQPADYGIIAILDLTVDVLRVFLGRGLTVAVNRYHFDAKDEMEQSRVWWTGFIFLGITVTAIVMSAWCLRSTLAYFTLGPDQRFGEYYYTLVLATLWCGIAGELPATYIRVRKWSMLYVSVALICLFVNIGFNIYFVVIQELGVSGVLIGNFITAVMRMVVLLSIAFLNIPGPYTFQWSLAYKLWHFAWPLIGTSLLALIMHQADRYLLRLFLDLDQVGFYSLAYTAGQGINTLILTPFSAIWGIEIYEIARQPYAKAIYARVFQYFVYSLMLVVFGVSLFIRPLFEVLLPPIYIKSADLVPIICLAYVFFSLHEHFKVPAFITKQTMTLLPAYLSGAILNLMSNLFLIPLWGANGSAWSSVLTFFVFSFTGLWYYRKIDRYNYPMLRCGMVLIGMAASYMVYRLLLSSLFEPLWSLCTAAGVWIVWAIVLLGPPMWRLMIRQGSGVGQELVLRS
jgi:O-antigen/teichoic acid export membrane protein